MLSPRTATSTHWVSLLPLSNNPKRWVMTPFDRRGPVPKGSTACDQQRWDLSLGTARRDFLAPSRPPVVWTPVAELQPAGRQTAETGWRRGAKCHGAHPRKSQQSNLEKETPTGKGAEKGRHFFLVQLPNLQNVTLLASNFHHSGNLSIPCQEEVSLFGKAKNLENRP